MLLDEFLRQHAEEKLAPKTVERYREQAAYISLELLAKPLAEITPLHLTREWARLLKSGGHTRKTKSPPFARSNRPTKSRLFGSHVASRHLLWLSADLRAFGITRTFERGIR